MWGGRVSFGRPVQPSLARLHPPSTHLRLLTELCVGERRGETHELGKAPQPPEPGLHAAAAQPREAVAAASTRGCMRVSCVVPRWPRPDSCAREGGRAGRDRVGEGGTDLEPAPWPLRAPRDVGSMLRCGCGLARRCSVEGEWASAVGSRRGGREERRGGRRVWAVARWTGRLR